jgi:hypothetical protein
MSKQFVFWLLMLLWIIFGAYMHWPSQNPPPRPVFVADSILLFALLFLLGWQVFGFMIQ